MNQEALKIAFGDCKRADTSKCRLSTSYEVLSTKKFFVYDENNEEPVSILSDKGNSQLIVINKGKLEICVIKTDKCLFTDNHKKCDCILFSNNKVYLVEIKSGKKRGHARQTAVIQLADTIKLLRNNNLHPSAHATKAVICFREGRTKPLQASFNTQRAIFLKEYNVSLEEGNEIIF